MKNTLTLLTLILISTVCYSQKNNEDRKYEMKHKSQSWFLNMKDGANYSTIKKEFDTYFGSYKWEESKPRNIGESWLKEKIFYLDKMEMYNQNHF